MGHCGDSEVAGPVREGCGRCGRSARRRWDPRLPESATPAEVTLLQPTGSASLLVIPGVETPGTSS